MQDAEQAEDMIATAYSNRYNAGPKRGGGRNAQTGEQRVKTYLIGDPWAGCRDMLKPHTHKSTCIHEATKNHLSTVFALRQHIDSVKKSFGTFDSCRWLTEANPKRPGFYHWAKRHWLRLPVRHTGNLRQSQEASNLGSQPMRRTKRHGLVVWNTWNEPLLKSNRPQASKWTHCNFICECNMSHPQAQPNAPLPLTEAWEREAWQCTITSWTDR